MSPRAERLDILDGLRGLAIALVVWYHVWLVTGLTAWGVNFIAEAGFLGVDLFFFISGFCLFRPYASASRDDKPLPSVSSFLRRRSAKIIPSYLLALATFSIVYRDRFGSPQDAAVQVMSHLTFVHPLIPASISSISGPLWTIGVEVQFYLLFPLVCGLFLQAPFPTYAALVIVSESYRRMLAAGGLASFWWINQLPGYLDIFGAGMIAAYLLVLVSRKPDPLQARALTLISVLSFGVAAAALEAVSFIGKQAGDMNVGYIWANDHRSLIGPLCVALTLPTFFAASRWRTIVAAPVLVFLSAISYNLYLWHLEIFVWLNHTGLPASLSIAFALLGAVVVATAITYLIERPIINWSREPAATRALAELARRASGRVHAVCSRASAYWSSTSRTSSSPID